MFSQRSVGMTSGAERKEGKAVQINAHGEFLTTSYTPHVFALFVCLFLFLLIYCMCTSAIALLVVNNVSVVVWLKLTIV